MLCKAPSSESARADLPKVVRRRAFHIEGKLLFVNSCPLCSGERTCRKCFGAGGGGTFVCPRCGDFGTCHGCRDHIESLRTFAGEVIRGELDVAEASIARALSLAGENEGSAKAGKGIGGLGIGALVGTLLLPGIGTAVGGMIGKAIGDGESSTVSASFDWQRSDLYFALGKLYEMRDRKVEARQAWIKAMSFNGDHHEARAALKELI